MRLPNPIDILKTTYNAEESELDLEIALCCNKEIIISMLREYGKKVRDKTLEWAAENTHVKSIYVEDEWGMNRTLVSKVDKKSILSGKTHKDLEI